MAVPSQQLAAAPPLRAPSAVAGLRPDFAPRGCGSLARLEVDRGRGDDRRPVASPLNFDDVPVDTLIMAFDRATPSRAGLGDPLRSEV